MKINRRQLRKMMLEALGGSNKGSGAFDEDVPGYGDLEDPYSGFAFDVDEEPEGDFLAPGEEFQIFEFELDLQEFADDPAALSSILGKAKELGGITVHFRSTKDKLLGLASRIHGTGGPGPSFAAEEFAEFNLFPVSPGE